MVNSESTERDGGVSWPAKAALAAAALLRLAWPFGGSPTHVDEGGWPLSVRQWASEGLVTFDFHTAPAYHLVLGAVFEVFPPTMLTARIFSVLLGFITLWLFWFVARRLLPDRRTALWAVLLWAACFPGNEIAGRALIEPLQMAWLLGLLALLCSNPRRMTLLAAVLTAGLLLTKANAVVLLPAFVLAMFWDTASPLRERRREKITGIVAGTLVAVLAYAALYLYDAATFRLGWDATMGGTRIATAPDALRFGRFILDPRLVEAGLEFLGRQAPFLLVLGLVGMVRALSLRIQGAAALWVAVLLPFLLLQAVQTPHYFSLLYPALALLAAALLGTIPAPARGRHAWTALVIGMIVGDGLVRSVAAMAIQRPAERDAVAWMREHVGPGDRVLGPPYVLMQLPVDGISYFEFRPPAYAPDSAALAHAHATWVVLDTIEWRPRLRDGGIDSAATAALLATCCEEAYTDAAVRVFRDRSRRPGGMPRRAP